MRAMWSRIRALFRGNRLDGELNDEVGFHLARLEDDFRERGMTAAEAKLAARREFGGVTQAQEVYRDRRGIPWLETSLKDLRYALRGLRRNPGFTAAAALSLALGIGANTAVFSLFYSLMMRRLPAPRPEEMLWLRKTGGLGNMDVSSYPLYQEIAKRTDLFSGVLARTNVSIPGFGAPADVVAWEIVSGNYFSVLGVPPAAGRLLTEDDNRAGNLVAVMSFDYWQGRFGGDPGAIGRTVGRYRVIGVAAPGFRGVELDRRPDLWSPMAAQRNAMDDPRVSFVQIMARRRPGISLRQVQAAIDVLAAHHFAALYGGDSGPPPNKALEQRFEVRDASVGLSSVRNQFGKPLTALMAAVVLVLLAACGNVANLLLARGAARSRETALRLSLGATRARLVRQALTESGLLAALGAAFGVLLAYWGRRYILHFLPSVSGNPFDAPERMALAFAAGVSVLSAVLSGLAPALRSTTVDPATGLRSGFAPAMRGATLRGALVAAQVAFSVVLVALATLFGASLGELRTFDRGFANLNAIQFGLRLSSVGAKEAFLAKIEATPGVTSVTGGNAGPYPSRMGGRSLGLVRVSGSEKTARAPGQVAIYSVADAYFKTIGATVLSGREFDRGDAAGTRDDIAIVNQAFVREFMSAEAHAVGRTFSFDNGRPEGGKQTRIIGVVRDISHDGLRERAAPGVYLRMERANASFVLVATKLPPAALLPALRRDVARLGSQGTVSEPLTLSEEIDQSIYQDRILAALSGCFGALALLLAAVGLYGVVAYRTLQRTTEIGVRIALGAERAGIVWLVLRNALALVALGLAVGLPVAYAAVKAAGAIVFGVKPGNPWLFAFTAVALLAAGAAAALIPARRAAQMDPLAALRHD